MFGWKSAFLYLALALGANGLAADPYGLTDLREDSLKKLVVHETPRDLAEVPFTTAEGGAAQLSDYAGKALLVNFWATWCAPCRAEMPMLSALQADLGGEGFEVVTIATGRNARPAMEKFLSEVGAENLPMHTDPRQQLARASGVLGLPVTLLVDAEGREVARLTGEAEWDSASARAIIAALIPKPTD